MSEQQPLMLPAKEAARLLGIPLSALHRERRRGHIRAKRIGTQYYYHRATLENYAATTEEGAGEHSGAPTSIGIHSLRRNR